jgi:hypothetical protein
MYDGKILQLAAVETRANVPQQVSEKIGNVSRCSSSPIDARDCAGLDLLCSSGIVMPTTTRAAGL